MSFRVAGGRWRLDEKMYFNQRGAKVSAADWHPGSGMLVVAFTNGIFDLYEMPGFRSVHTLSVTRERLSAAAFNSTGSWVCALRCHLGACCYPHHTAAFKPGAVLNDWCLQSLHTLSDLTAVVPSADLIRQSDSVDFNTGGVWLF